MKAVAVESNPFPTSSELSSETSLEAWLVTRLAARLGVAPSSVRTGDSFVSLGLDSVGAVALLAELSTALGRKVPATVAFAHPSVKALARHLAGAPTPAAVAPTPRSAPRPAPAPAPVRAAPADVPIAIVGIGCRFPGGAVDPRSYFRLLCDEIDAIGDVPVDRWDVDRYFDADPSAPGTMYSRAGGFLADVDRFDPLFFGISPREAAHVDPQQRLMLELAWQAFEDAGIRPAGLRGSRTAVYVGATTLDYAALQHRASAASIAPHTATGYLPCIISNRISYVFGLRGPSMTIDSACSSSLVAVHLALQSLRSGEATL